MTLRRIPMLLLVVAALVAVVVGARDTTTAGRPIFSTAAVGWMPAAPRLGGLTESWFCPGVPASGIDGVEGTVLIANRTGEQRVGSVLVFDELAQNVRLDLRIEAWSIATVDLDATLPGAMVGALVEVDGGGVLVEQQAVHPSGNSSSACANATSDSWYLADGFTVDNSLDQIVLANPFDQTVVATIEFATREGPRAPGSYSSITVQARSTRVIDLGAPGAGAQGEPILAVKITTSRGRIVVGRSQWFLGGGRLGTQVTLASPTPRDQWWFSNGRKGPAFTERYVIYNPSDEDVEVDPIFLGIPTLIQGDPISVPEGEVVSFDPALMGGLPDGSYSVVFSTLAAESIVVERVTTEVSDDGAQIGTSSIAGATPRIDGYLATRWYVAVAPSTPTVDALAIHNADNAEGTVTVSALGASGPVAVPGLVDVPIAVAQRVVLDLVDPVALGRTLVIESTNRIFVEQSFPTGRGDLRVSSWAIPASG